MIYLCQASSPAWWSRRANCSTIAFQHPHHVKYLALRIRDSQEIGTYLGLCRLFVWHESCCTLVASRQLLSRWGNSELLGKKVDHDKPRTQRNWKLLAKDSQQMGEVWRYTRPNGSFKQATGWSGLETVWTHCLGTEAQREETGEESLYKEGSPAKEASTKRKLLRKPYRKIGYPRRLRLKSDNHVKQIWKLQKFRETYLILVLLYLRNHVSNCTLRPTPTLRATVTATRILAQLGS